MAKGGTCGGTAPTGPKAKLAASKYISFLSITNTPLRLQAARQVFPTFSFPFLDIPGSPEDTATIGTTGDTQERLAFDHDPQNPFCKNWESVRGEEPTKVKGRLREHYDRWVTIGANETVLPIVRQGYRIPFLSNPLRAVFNNNRSAIEHEEYVGTAIREFLGTGRIQETVQPP